jgi:hypothetical protein
MAKKTSTVPTRIYSYGCLAPVEGADIVEQQLRAANKYYNDLIAIGRDKRQRWEDLVAEVHPEADLWEMAQVAVSGAVDALRRAKTGTGRRADVDGEKELLAVVKAERKALGPAAKEARARLRVAAEEAALARRESRVPAGPDAVLAARIADSDALASRELRAKRAACGVYWGTYLVVEDAAKRALGDCAFPRFKRFDGTGKVAVQLTGEIRDASGAVIDHGVPVSDVIAGAGSGSIGRDTRLRIDAAPSHPHPVDPVKEERWRAQHPGKVRRVRTTMVKIRVGSNPDRTPVWAAFPVVRHRPLPDDAVLKWAWVVRRRVGIRFEYRFQVTIEAPSLAPPAQAAGHGTVAINLGWRNIPPYDGAVRLAVWRDDEGREGEIRVPRLSRRDSTGAAVGYHLNDALRKMDEVRGARDRALDEFKAWARGVDRSSWPPWLADMLRFLPQWRASRKLARVAGIALRMCRQGWRFSGDDEILVGLALWAQRDRHLLAWEAHGRDRAIGHRRKVYEEIAVYFTRRYARILICEMDMRDLREREAPEDGVPADGRDMRRTANVAAPGELREKLRIHATKRGDVVEEVANTNLTQTCHACGVCPEEPWDAARAIDHTCGACGATWDQDINHVRNIMAREANRASGEAARGDAPPLADGNNARPRRNITRSFGAGTAPMDV